jgi:membrane protein implicated in regulation of membrane protease activity
MIFSINDSLFWFLLGIALMLLELLMPGFVVIFFGIGAIITAAITYFGLSGNLTVQIVIFLVTSIVSLVLFRRKWSASFKGVVARKFKQGESIDNIIGKKAVVKEDIIPGKLQGKVEFNGTMWDVECDEHVKAGGVVEIIEQKNLKLKVKKTGD